MPEEARASAAVSADSALAVGVSGPGLVAAPALLLALFTGVRGETVWKFSGTGQAPHHKPYHRGVHERLRAGAQPLVVLAHPPVLREPREGPLHHPPPR